MMECAPNMWTKRDRWIFYVQTDLWNSDIRWARCLLAFHFHSYRASAVSHLQIAIKWTSATYTIMTDSRTGYEAHFILSSTYVLNVCAMPFISFNRIYHIYFPFHASRSLIHFHINTNTHAHSSIASTYFVYSDGFRHQIGFFLHGYWIYTRLSLLCAQLK